MQTHLYCSETAKIPTIKPSSTLSLPLLLFICMYCTQIYRWVANFYNKYERIPMWSSFYEGFSQHLLSPFFCVVNAVHAQWKINWNKAWNSITFFYFSPSLFCLFFRNKKNGWIVKIPSFQCYSWMHMDVKFTKWIALRQQTFVSVLWVTCVLSLINCCIWRICALFKFPLPTHISLFVCVANTHIVRFVRQFGKLSNIFMENSDIFHVSLYFSDDLQE